MKPKAIFLMGPTATGKTDLAIEIVARYPCEIVSVDSVMVYKGMDIGSAKPDSEVLTVAPHHLIDVCDVAEPYSAADFVEDTLAVMAEITQRGRVPLLVGGTMMYFKALENGLSTLPAADDAVRARLLESAQRIGWPEMHVQLQRIDPQAAARIEPNDSQRIQRALEVFELTGRSLSEHQQQQVQHVFPYQILKIALCADDRSQLHQRIEMRFQQMVEAGFIGEVEGFYKRPDVHVELPSMRAVGYRQIWHFLDGKLDKKTAIEKGVIATRQLAKRQMTWVRSQTQCERIDWERRDIRDAVFGPIDKSIF